MMSQVISDSQRKLNQELHQIRQDFGNRPTGAGLAENLSSAILKCHKINMANSILDYGTGKGKLIKHLKKKLPPNILVDGYDPAVDEFSSKSDKQYDIVTCLDVLEHVELDSINKVLEDIHQSTKNICYLIIDLQPAMKKLSDGRNAHILIAPSDWWIGKVSNLFPIVNAFPIMHECGEAQKLVIGAAKDNSAISALYKFIFELRIFESKMVGGILNKVQTKN